MVEPLIKQIIPAPGWFAIWIDIDEDPPYRIYPVAGWALVVFPSGETHIDGFFAELQGTPELFWDNSIYTNSREGVNGYGFVEYIHERTLDDMDQKYKVLRRIRERAQRLKDQRQEKS